MIATLCRSFFFAAVATLLVRVMLVVFGAQLPLLALGGGLLLAALSVSATFMLVLLVTGGARSGWAVVVSLLKFPIVIGGLLFAYRSGESYLFATLLGFVGGVLSVVGLVGRRQPPSPQDETT